MKPKRRRLYMVGALLLGVGAAAALVLTAFQDNLVFFYAPTDLLAKHVAPDRRFRLGGLVETGSVTREADGVTVHFTVTDLTNRVPVTFKGVLPDLFREGQGVVAEGALNAQGAFIAADVLARHDEKYMPPEVAAALKASGKWRPEATTQAKSP